MARPSLRSSQSSGKSMGAGVRSADTVPPRRRPHGCRAKLLQQFDGAGQSADGVFRVLRFFEAHGGVSAQPDGGGSAADAGRLEVRALQHDACGGDRKCAIPPPITPARPIGPAASAITRFDCSSVYVSLFSAANFSPACARAHEDGIARSRSASKACMGCAISDITKLVMSTMLLMEFSPMAARRALQPQRRRPHGHVLQHQRRVTRAQIGVFDGDFDRGGAGGQRAASPDPAT